MSTNRSARRLWVESEDQKLRDCVQQQKAVHGMINDWNQIALALPTRSNKDCRKRWSKIYKNVKKGSWDAEEDLRLKEAVKSCGMRWTQVAEYVGTRHADQCAKRWTHSLDPNLNQNDWTEEEDEVLLAVVSEKGRNWKYIAETKLIGRSKLMIKNRYAVAQNKRRHQETAPHQPRVMASDQPRVVIAQQSPAMTDGPSDDSADSKDRNEDPNIGYCHGFKRVGAPENNVDLQYAVSWEMMECTNFPLSFGNTLNDPVNWNSFDNSWYGVDMMSADQQVVSAAAVTTSNVHGLPPAHFITDSGSMTPPFQHINMMTTNAATDTTDNNNNNMWNDFACVNPNANNNVNIVATTAMKWGASNPANGTATNSNPDMDMNFDPFGFYHHNPDTNPETNPR